MFQLGIGKNGHSTFIAMELGRIASHSRFSIGSRNRTHDPKSADAIGAQDAILPHLV